MRSVRVLLTAAAIGALALLGTAGCRKASLASVSSSSTTGVFVTVSPTTVNAGSAITIRASCVDNTSTATISSPAFGSTTVQPIDGVLSTSVVIPADTKASTFEVTLVCRNGSRASATVTIINAQASAPATMGPNTGGGFLANAAGTMTSGPFIWIAVGPGSIVAAIVVNVRNRRAARRVKANQR
jgi:hypothetical protein